MSGTQICIGRIPDALRLARCLCTRSDELDLILISVGNVLHVTHYHSSWLRATSLLDLLNINHEIHIHVIGYPLHARKLKQTPPNLPLTREEPLSGSSPDKGELEEVWFSTIAKT